MYTLVRYEEGRKRTLRKGRRQSTRYTLWRSRCKPEGCEEAVGQIMCIGYLRTQTQGGAWSCTERSWQRWDEASRIVQLRGWGKTPDRSWKSLSREVSQSPAGHGKLGEMGKMGGNGGKWGEMGGKWGEMGGGGWGEMGGGEWGGMGGNGGLEIV